MANQSDRRVVEIEKGISFGMASGAVIEVTKKYIEPDSIGKAASGKPWAIWGKDNNYAQNILDENMQDTTSANAIRFKISAHYGKGLYFYREEINAKGQETKIPLRIQDLIPDMQEFWYVNDLQNFQQGVVKDYEWFENYYVQYIPNALFTKILRVKWQRTKDARIGKRDITTGEIPKFYLSSQWPTPKDDQVRELPAFDRLNPLNPEVPNGIYRHQFVSNDKDYYTTPLWHSNIHWVRISTKVAKWINANIDNSVNIKYHVEIPEQYFLDLYPEKMFPEGREACYKARIKAERELKEEIDRCLAGADNAQKIFYTKFAVDQEGNVRPGWKITALPNDLKDTAWLSADATAASRILSAHGVDPTLSGLRTGSSSFGVGSGSDMREKFNFYMQLQTTIPRQTTLEWYDIVQRANRWPMDIKLGYREIILDTLNSAKSGFQVENEESPTSKAA